MIKVLMDTSALTGGHSTRGIGTYTRLLTAELEKLDELKLFRTSTVSKKKRIKKDIVHYPYFDLFFSTLPISLFKNRVVTIHDVIPLKFADYYKPGVKGKLRFKKQKLALKTVAAIITDSKASKSDIVSYLGVPEEKIHVVYLAANPKLKPQDEKMIKRVKKKNKLPDEYLLYVGDINYNKNIPQLIKMMKFLPKNLHLVCLGRNFVKQDIPEWSWIETQLALSDAKDRTHFLNNVLTDSVDELAAIYSGAVAYVQPSLYEGFGLPVLEAMRCKTPVVSAKNSSLVEVGGDHVVFCETDAESLAKGVLEVSSWSKSKRNKFIKEAYEWSENFSWEKAAKETLEVYKKVLGKS